MSSLMKRKRRGKSIPKPKVREKELKSGVVLVSKKIEQINDEGVDKIKQEIGFRYSLPLALANKFLGSSLKRLNLKEYPKDVVGKATLAIFMPGKNEHLLEYSGKVKNFQIVYDALGVDEKGFNIELSYPIANKIELTIPKFWDKNKSYIQLMRELRQLETLYRFDHSKRMYFITMPSSIQLKVKFNIEIYLEDVLCFKTKTDLAIYQDNYTILPVFFIPRYFLRESLNMGIRIHFDDEMESRFNMIVHTGLPFLKPVSWGAWVFHKFGLSPEKYIFKEARELIANEDEFEKKFKILDNS